MSIERLPFEHRPRNSIANNLDRINELIDWVNLDTHLYASASGERVTVDDASSLKGLTVDGRSVQDGTPTPDAPVPVQVVEGPLTLNIGTEAYAIDLQGNVLASLPDGTRDELHVDSAGKVTLEKRVPNVTFNGSENWKLSGGALRVYTTALKELIVPAPDAAASQIWCNRFTRKKNLETYNGTIGISVNGGGEVGICQTGSTMTVADFETWLASNNVIVYYRALNPQTIDLGYIAPPAIPSGSVVTVSASLTPTIHLEWWVDDGITALADDLIAYVDYKTEG